MPTNDPNFNTIDKERNHPSSLHLRPHDETPDVRAANGFFAGVPDPLATRVASLRLREAERGWYGLKGLEGPGSETGERVRRDWGESGWPREMFGEASYAPKSRPVAIAVLGPAACFVGAGALFQDRYVWSPSFLHMGQISI